MLAMLVTLGTIGGGDFTSYGSHYILLINVALFAFAAMPVAGIVGNDGHGTAGGRGQSGTAAAARDSAGLPASGGAGAAVDRVR